MVASGAVVAQTGPQDLALQGWRHESAPGAIERYRCESPKCGRDAVVSYQLQPVKHGYTLQAFRSEKERDYASLGMTPPFGGTGLFAGGSLKIGAPVLGKLRQTPLMTIQARATLRSGEPHVRVSGYLLGRNQTVSLISSAADSRSARRNFDLYAAVLARQEEGGRLK